MKASSIKKELLLQKKFKSMKNIKFYILVLFFLMSCKSDEVLFNLTTEVSPADSGSITPKSGSVWLGDQIKLNATPNTGYSFDHWASGDSSSEILYDSINSSSISVIVNSDITITGNFLPKTQLNDSSFEKYLIEIGVDDILDGFVNTKKCLSITSMNLSDKNIRNLTGINIFKNLEVLLLDNNFLEDIDLSQNTKLEILSISNNLLSNLDLSSNTSIKSLGLDKNNIESIDLSQNTKLEILSISNNFLSDIDLSSNTSIKSLGLDKNKIETIDLSYLTLLSSLNLSANNLSSLDLSLLSLLNDLDVRINANLTCIKVDSAQKLTGWLKDSIAEFKLNC